MAVPYYGDFAEDDTVNIPFNTFDSNDPSNSVTATDLLASDIYVHKDGSATPITTDGASIDVDAPGVGAHMITIDTGADAAYATGSEYAVRVDGVTVDGGTINAWVGAFSIERASGALALVKAVKTKTDFLPSATAGSAGGVFIAGTNAATTITTALTTTFTGNLTGSVDSVTTKTGYTLAATTGLGNQTANITGNLVGSVTGNVDGNVTGTVAGVTPATAADVNAQVKDVIDTDNYAELTDVPAASVPLATKIGWLYMLARNKVTQTSDTQALRNDGDSAEIGTAAVTDAAGTFTRGQWTDTV